VFGTPTNPSGLMLDIFEKLKAKLKRKRT